MDGASAVPEESGADVFLCHNSRDKNAIKIISERLIQEFELKTFLDETDVLGGELWKDRIRAALESSRTCAIILGPSGWGSFQFDDEAVPALARQKRDPSFRLIPVLLPGVNEADMLRLDDFFTTSQWVDFRKDWDDAIAIYRLVAAIKGEKAFPVGKPELTPTRIRFDALRHKVSRDSSILYSGGQLREAQAIRARIRSLEQESEAFLSMSEWRQRRTLISVVSALVAVILMLSYLAYRASVGEARAKQEAALKEKALQDLTAEQRVVLSRQAAADNSSSRLAWEAADRDSSLLYAVHAYQAAEKASDPLASSYGGWAFQLAREFPQFSAVLPGDIWNVIFSPDASEIKVSTGDTNQVWSVRGAVPALLSDLPRIRTGPVSFYGFSASGKHLVGEVGSGPRSGNYIVWQPKSGGVWNLQSNRFMSKWFRTPRDAWILAAYPGVLEDSTGQVVLAWRADNELLAVDKNGRVIISTFDGPMARRTRLPVVVPGFVVNGDTGRFVDIASGQTLGQVDTLPNATVERWALTRDAKYAAAVWRASPEKAAMSLWGRGDRSPIYSAPLEAAVTIASIDPSEAPSSILMLSYADESDKGLTRNYRVWNPRTGEIRLLSVGPSVNRLSVAPCDKAALLKGGKWLALLRDDAEVQRSGAASVDHPVCALEIRPVNDLRVTEWKVEIPEDRLLATDLAPAEGLARFAFGDGRVARWALTPGSAANGQQLRPPLSSGLIREGGITDRYVATIDAKSFSRETQAVSGEIRALDRSSTCRFSFNQPPGAELGRVFAGPDYLVAPATVIGVKGNERPPHRSHLAVIPAHIAGCESGVRTIDSDVKWDAISAVVYSSDTKSLLVLSRHGDLAQVNLAGSLNVRYSSTRGIGGAISRDGHFAAYNNANSFHLYRVSELSTRNPSPSMNVPILNDVEASSVFDKQEWLNALTSQARSIEPVSLAEAVFELSSGTRVRVRASLPFAEFSLAKTGQTLQIPARQNKLADQVFFSPNARWAAVVTASPAYRVSVYDLRTGALAMPPVQGELGDQVAFSADGNHILIAGSERVRTELIASGDSARFPWLSFLGTVATAKELRAGGAVTVRADTLRIAREELIRSLKASAPSSPEAEALLAHFDAQWEVSQASRRP